ncbi:MAG: sulfotransferase [Saprospiraceae bacterium]|nr:sulfotransferase [Saprospiraceae bacterium]
MLQSTSFRSISNEIAILRKQNPNSFLDWGILSDLFPNCKHIFLSRRNKVALVVSWWKAIQDGQWHVKDHNPASKSLQVYKGRYDFNALVHLLHDHCLRETAAQAFFEHNQITPYSIFYEDLLLDLSGTISGILRYLNIELEEGQGIPLSDFKSTSDQINSEWIDRLRNDLQKDSDKVIW